MDNDEISRRSSELAEKSIDNNNLLNHVLAYLLNTFCQGKISLNIDQLNIIAQQYQGLKIFKPENSDVFEISVLSH